MSARREDCTGCMLEDSSYSLALQCEDARTLHLHRQPARECHHMNVDNATNKNPCATQRHQCDDFAVSISPLSVGVSTRMRLTRYLRGPNNRASPLQGTCPINDQRGSIVYRYGIYCTPPAAFLPARWTLVHLSATSGLGHYTKYP